MVRAKDKKQNTKRSYSGAGSIVLSLGLHTALLLVMFNWKFDYPAPVTELVEIGFGFGGPGSSAGSAGSEMFGEVNDLEEGGSKNLPADPAVQDENTSSNSPSEEAISSKTKPTNKDNTSTYQSDKEGTGGPKGMGNDLGGPGGFGYDIEWGGGGQRKIYSYVLPEYPSGVNKEIDIRLRFTILADGTVGNVFPLTKADTRLENAAINSLKQWRFEPLRKGQKQVEQIAVIVFPYRLQ